jgi:hypothetical protein
MFINQIDEIINNIIDLVYKKKINTDVLIKNKSLLDIIDKKMYKNINNLLGVRYSNNIINIIETIILYLIILLPGIKQKDFTKYIIELSKKNINLLDPETISKIIKIYNVYTDIKLKKNKDLINDIDEFFLKNKESEFNLIKIIIVNYVYLGEYRHHILELIENKELENTESKIIEIIDSKEDEIDYNNLEMLFDINEKYLSEIFYQMIVDYENNIFEDNLSSEQKINKLFNKRILIPITDEFIRYNKYTDKIKNTNVKLDNIRKVITNINTVVDIYSKKDIDHNKIFYQQLLCKKAILYNNVEEIISINKLLNIGLSATRSNEYFQDLLIYREYSYINFNNFKNYGFSFLPCHSINMNNFLETRVLTINNRVNVVGVALPKNNLFNTNSVLQCTIIKNTYDLDNIKNNKYEVILKLIKQMLLNNINYKKLPYWIFDKNKDVFITDTYNDINELTFEEFYKYMIASIYDIVIDITYQKIINNVNKCTTLQSCYNISDYVQNKLINLSNNYIYNSNLEKVFIETTKIKKKIKYDKNEDIIPGITTDLIKLPKYKYNKHKLINIYISNNNDNNNNDNYDDNNKYSTCQHNISWEKMYIHKKKNPNYFNQLLFEFKKKYITVNLEGNFVCKSCYQPVNIKKYAFDWTTETEEGIGLSFTLETQLKDLSEYEKYNKIILQLDKYIERIATGVNLPIYIGNIPQIKIRRQGIVKNIIDFINIQNKTLRINDSNERKKRLEKVEKLFGIKKTQFFIFELENDIFLYSSKEVDKYKRSKLNNIYIYAIMFLINEISLNQVLFFIEDKNINIETFKKNYKSLFSDLYIYVNNNKELKPLYNFPLLCYILYIFSGVLIKYNLWYNPTKIKVFDYNLYSSIIHTYVDLLNSILEVNTLKEKNYLYEVYATKFYIQLNKVFNSNKLLINKNINNINEKKQKDNIITTILTGKIIEPQFGFNNFYSRSALKFLLTMTNNKIQINYNDINKSLENWSNDLLYVLYNYYNLDGTKRFIDDVKNENVNKNELFKMLKNIIHRRKILSDNIEKKRLEYNKNINNKLLEYKQYNDNLNKDVKNNKKNIFNLIQNLEKIVNINLSNNQYIIDHDISGNKLKNPIIIMEGDKKIQFKRNDIKYGTNIYIYEDNNNLYVYNAITLNMIAYKNNLNKIINVNLPLYLNINYSLKHQLLFLGHEKIYYNIKDLGAHKKKIINNLIRNRILNLKNIIINIQRILQQIHNKYDNNNININIIAKNYMNKFKNINITLDNSEIKNIINNIYFVPFDYNLTLKEDSEYIYIGSLQIIQNNDNIILDFICNELIKLLNANTNDKYILTNLALIIIDIIKKEYNNYMKRNNSLNNIEVRKFIETKSNLLIFNNKDNMDDFIDVNIQNNDEEDNDEIENGNGYDVDINSEDDENEALFTID